MSTSSSRWRTQGVRVIRADELDDATAQTLGMHRRAAVTTDRTGATKLWAGTVTIDAKAKTGAHHHGDLESVIYVRLAGGWLANDARRHGDDGRQITELPGDHERRALFRQFAELPDVLLADAQLHRLDAAAIAESAADLA